MKPFLYLLKTLELTFGAAPKLKVTLVINPEFEFLVKELSYISVYKTIDGTSFISRWVQFNRILKADQFAAYLNFSRQSSFNMFARLKNIKLRAGSNHNILDAMFLNHGRWQARKYAMYNEIDANLEIVRLLFPLEFAEEKIKIQAPSIIKKILLIAPNGKHTPSWGARNFARLIAKIEAENPNQYHYTWLYKKKHAKLNYGFSSELADYTPELNSKIDHIVLENQTNFQDLKNIFKEYDLVIGNAQAENFMAQFLQMKSLTFYLPIRKYSLARWPVLNASNLIRGIVPAVVCGEVKECSKEQCPYFDCMAKLEVETVYNEFIKIVKGIK